MQDKPTRVGLELLKLAGDRHAQARPTDFFFYGEPEFVTALSGLLACRGFTMRPTLSGPGVVARLNVPTDAKSFTRLVNWLASLAGDLGVTFDGWETELVRTTH